MQWSVGDLPGLVAALAPACLVLGLGIAIEGPAAVLRNPASARAR